MSESQLNYALKKIGEKGWQSLPVEDKRKKVLEHSEELGIQKDEKFIDKKQTNTKT